MEITRAMKERFYALGFIGLLIVTGVAIYNLLSGKEVEEVQWLGGAGLKFRPIQTPILTEKIQSSPKVQKTEPVVIKDTTPETYRPSPEQEIVTHFSDINNRLYQAAWDRLPTALQENKDVHPDGFKSFEEWYESMTSVDVKEVNVKNNDSDNAEVNVRVGYNFKDGRTGSNSLRYLLSWDIQAEKWRIIKIKKN